MSMYCLVARNKKDNSFKVIGIKERWYNFNGDDQILSYKNTLASIDLVTSRFKSHEEMQRRLIERGYLDNGEYDFFIASKNKSSASSPMKFQEVIYGPEKNERMADFKEIASASHRGKLEESHQKILRVFNKLISKSYYDHSYYYMIMNGYTGIPKKLMDALDGMIELKDVPYGIKFKQRWAMESYPVIRNIIESLNRYDLLSSNNNDLVRANIIFLGDNYRQRRTLVPKLLQILDKDFTVGQISMFDADNLSENFAVQNVREDIPVVVEEEELVEPIKKEVKPKIKFPVFDDESDISKISKIMRFLTSLPYEVFIYDRNRQLTFNFDVFNHEINDETKKKLNSLLTSHLRNYVHMYLFHKKKLDEVNGIAYGHSPLIFAEDMEEDKKDIKKNLEKRSEAGLNRVYEWCKICSINGQLNDIMMDDVSYSGDDDVSRKKK